MTVTVCIPAYRAGGFIAETVASVLQQSHAALKVIVAIDPPADGGPDDTEAALALHAADPRLRLRHNPRRLGWADNVNSMIAEIDTPYYCFLPHDDVWAETYLETLLDALAARPDAVTAYSDFLRFGATPPVRKSTRLPPGADRTAALLQFLLQGTEGHMWRGLSRTRALEKIGGFPTDGHGGLIVECEYSLALHGAGGVCHVPRVLYFKRIHPKDTISASRERMLQPREALRAGWQEHDRRMAILLQAALDDMRASDADRALCHAAKEVALLKRFQQFVEPRLDDGLLARAEAVLAWSGAAPVGMAAEVAAGMHLVLTRHHQAWRNVDAAAGHRRLAWETAETFATVLAHAQALRQEGRLLQALERATEAMRIGHHDEPQSAAALIDQLYANLGWNV